MRIYNVHGNDTKVCLSVEHEIFICNDCFSLSPCLVPFAILQVSMNTYASLQNMSVLKNSSISSVLDACLGTEVSQCASQEELGIKFN